LNNKKKLLLAGLGFCAVVLAAVVVQSFVIKPPTTIKLAKLPAGEYDPAVWGRYYPLEYESYRKNLEMSPSPTGFGGSLKVQKSDKEPELLMNFKGMPFSKDYSEDRGHPYSIEDLKSSKRVTPQSVGACMTCKTPYIIDIFKQKWWEYAHLPLSELLLQAKHPISCASCHDPATMKLTVTNPAFIEAMQRKGVDVSKASREEMRSFVCGQCHAEYYFEPKTKKVVFPWDKGYLPEQMYAYYGEKPAGFEQDWIHPDSQAKMLKAQHPDFETWAGGVHGKSGVSCADCHMPFVLKNGQKYSSHWVTSPMRNVQGSCGTCHAQSADLLLERVKTEQSNIFQLQHIAGLTVARAHEVIGKASATATADQAGLVKARELVRKAQWFWDIVAAENGMGFHNPDQDMNTLGRSIDLAHQAVETANKAAGTQF
jgi:nitrite reductase (cytochrome c-552)